MLVSSDFVLLALIVIKDSMFVWVVIRSRNVVNHLVQALLFLHLIEGCFAACKLTGAPTLRVILTFMSPQHTTVVLVTKLRLIFTKYAFIGNLNLLWPCFRWFPDSKLRTFFVVRFMPSFKLYCTWLVIGCHWLLLHKIEFRPNWRDMERHRITHDKTNNSGIPDNDQRLHTGTLIEHQ